MHYNLLICGVGGQGILTLAQILGEAALESGLKAIVTVNRGLAQRCAGLGIATCLGNDSRHEHSHRHCTYTLH